MITVTRRIFTLTATAGLLAAPRQWLPDDLLARAKDVMPDQWCMIYCLLHTGRRIDGMSEIAHLQWIGDEYVVTTPLQYTAPYACCVAGFEIEPLVKGELADRSFLMGGDMLNLQLTLNVG